MKNLEITHGHSVQELVKSFTLPSRSVFGGTIGKQGRELAAKKHKMHKSKTKQEQQGI